MTVFDMKPLQVPVSSAETVINADIVGEFVNLIK